MPRKHAEGNRAFAPWLAEACRGVRELAHVSQSEVAELAGVQRSGIARFEDGKTWPRNPDRMVKAYALASGYGDSRRLWRIAIGLWERYGEDVEMEAPPRSTDLAGALDEYLRHRHEGGSAKSQARHEPRRRAAG